MSKQEYREVLRMEQFNLFRQIDRDERSGHYDYDAHDEALLRLEQIEKLLKNM